MDNKTNKPTYEELEAQVKQLAAENKKALTHSEALTVDNAALREVVERMIAQFEMSGISPEEGSMNPAKSLMFDAKSALFMPATDAFLSRLRNEARGEAIPEGYVLVPQEMRFSAESMEGICFHCGDGGHMFGDFTDGVLYVGEVDYGDGKKIHGLHIATADCPEEGCATICEFLPVLREGKAGEVCSD